MTFSPDIVSAVLSHMNTDHLADSVTIARAALAKARDERSVTTAAMTDFDEDAAYFEAVTEDGDPVLIEIPWPSGRIRDRADVRREVVAITQDAHAVLGIPFERH